MKLLEQLKAKGIAKVTITFNGSGDSGGVDGVYCCDKDNKEVKAGELEEALFRLGRAVIDNYDNIDFNDEGCFGEISLDVQSGKINIEINTRYVDYETEHKEARVEDYIKPCISDPG